MKTKITFLSVIIFFLSFNLTAQSITNVNKLNELSEQFSQEWAEKQTKALI